MLYPDALLPVSSFDLSPLPLSSPSTPSSPLPANKPRRARRTSAACIHCKTNKVKCDDARPCSRCQRRGWDQSCVAFSGQSEAFALASRSPLGYLPVVAPKTQHLSLPPKRKSCEGCRQKKVKCSMDKPCSRCSSNVVMACTECLEHFAAAAAPWGQDLGYARRSDIYRMLRPHKRKHVDKACAYCRRSKIGCDEARPCARCLKAGLSCYDRKDAKKDDEAAWEQAAVAASSEAEGWKAMLSACLTEGDELWTTAGAGTGVGGENESCKGAGGWPSQEPRVLEELLEASESESGSDGAEMSSGSLGEEEGFISVLLEQTEEGMGGWSQWIEGFS
ncbi:hypothetical protein GUITHDRAFT_104325 [Guillardia theta CCMP2712]|uniref:Zn(2)-C6 fungal-type domain-containing protein n=1 Tax=Guillardia theta (strain CCMP2712) TaxID=905079 RepID=L1JNS4_GUITC|nr:hypothetical protein GUITHDRAFT_104325 [Guillardia theta CCMP2712]EKX49929.1 hypothetical protein GUITHDRAFT_104325 [Guillardia theta CCMP2712]|eukprot:XP_005836909.1 hypothetical protein GUITHDRAFT_104325 [Guillardia theta CCMP2712]